MAQSPVRAGGVGKTETAARDRGDVDLKARAAERGLGPRFLQRNGGPRGRAVFLDVELVGVSTLSGGILTIRIADLKGRQDVLHRTLIQRDCILG